MTNAIARILLPLLIVTAVASGASAQDLRLQSARPPARLSLMSDTLASDSAPDNSAAYNDELSSIDTESDWATGLYVTATVLVAGGLLTTIFSGLAGMMQSAFGGQNDAAGVTAASAGVTLLGLLTYIPAIALDVDSGSRRDALEQRPSVRVRFAPTEGGAVVGLSGKF